MAIIVASTLVGAAHAALNQGNTMPQQVYQKLTQFITIDIIARKAHASMSDAVFAGASRGALFGVGIYVLNSAATLIGAFALAVLISTVFYKQIESFAEQVAAHPEVQRAFVGGAVEDE